MTTVFDAIRGTRNTVYYHRPTGHIFISDRAVWGTYLIDFQEDPDWSHDDNCAFYPSHECEFLGFL